MADRNAVLRTLADGASLSTSKGGSGRFSLPSIGILTQTAINLGAASEGPVRASALIEFGNEVNEVMGLGPPTWIRSDTQFGVRDVYRWGGEIPLNINDHLLAQVRNDSGAEVFLFISWTVKNG